MNENKALRMILTTFPEEKSALRMMQRLVTEKMVACAQVEGPIRAIYRWNEEVVIDEEWRVILKTTKSKEEELRLLVTTEHPYENPQWIALDAQASEDYSQWVRESVNITPQA